MSLKNQVRVVVSNVSPQLESLDYSLKRVVGQSVDVSADILCDGHDVLRARVMYKSQKDEHWSQVIMEDQGNDSWGASFKVEKQGFYEYFVEAWVDESLNWLYGTRKKVQTSQYVKSELSEGALCLRQAIERSGLENEFLNELGSVFLDDQRYEQALEHIWSEELEQLFLDFPSRFLADTSEVFKVYVDRKKALFSTWYEFFPRSASQTVGEHGTFKDCVELLPRVKRMGFDTLYFPPVHPIGEVNRKGKNNATVASDGDVGSPWGIGSHYGGHKSLHVELGSLEDFKELVEQAKDLGIEVAMDFALQAAPDHPWVKEHPNWFKWRPDGSIQYAENPPKKYQDILPIYFESEDWTNLWDEMLSCALYWVEEVGIRVFRVDNPHTKPFRFWNWLIREVQNKYPDVLFLAEAFTRPKIMNQLAKEGFSQGYTYFTWRTSKHELIQYMTELTTTIQKEYFRPNFWPNTPDINPFHLQGANESMHLNRYFLAATLSSNVGVYGPVFEFMISDAIAGKEEYLNSEKYQISHWDWEAENRLMVLISMINEQRYHLPSLQQTNNIIFCEIENPKLIAYLKYDDEKSCITLMVVNLDSHSSQQGSVRVPIYKLGWEGYREFDVEDVLTKNRYTWNTEWNFVELHAAHPFHLFKIKL